MVRPRSEEAYVAHTLMLQHLTNDHSVPLRLVDATVAIEQTPQNGVVDPTALALCVMPVACVRVLAFTMQFKTDIR